MSRNWDGVEWVDGQKVSRGSNGKITHIGGEPVSYGASGEPRSVGGKPIRYGPDDSPNGIGDSDIFQVSEGSYATIDLTPSPAAGNFFPSEKMGSKPKVRPAAGKGDVARRQRRENFYRDAGNVWFWALVMYVPTYIFFIFLHYSPLFFLRSPAYMSRAFEVASVFVVAATLMLGAVYVAEFKNPAERRKDGWEVKRLLADHNFLERDNQTIPLPVLYGVVFLPAWGFGYLLLGRAGTWLNVADLNLWYFIPALTAPGATYVFLNARYQWKMRDVYHRYFGTLVGFVKSVHYEEWQDSEGRKVRKPRGPAAIALLCSGMYFLLVAFGILAQSAS